ncbi:MAG: hypothetical protein QNI84_01010 [Henriciella sp.]|nr:hypothetical protein [Henriciella sp.]
MVFKSVILSLVASTLVGAAFADAENQTDLPGEALAWTLAAYVSCDDADALQQQIRAEISAFGADGEETLQAMKILTSEDTACGALRLYAIDLVSLATTDMSAFEAALEVQEQQDLRQSETELPEGPEAVTTSLVEATVADVPLSSEDQTSSDYQN